MKPAKTKRNRARPPTTAVPDRSAMPLGEEARRLVEALRLYGARPDIVPQLGAGSAEAWEAWRKQRSAPLPLPALLVDWACALLAVIPERPGAAPPGRKPDLAADHALAAVTTLKMPKATAALWAARSEAWRKLDEQARRDRDERAACAAAHGKPLQEEDGAAVAARAEKLRRKLHPSRRRRPTKLKN